MLGVGDVVDNRTICDLFGVSNMGGIRVCKARNLIVLISNNTDPIYRNEWKDDVLHFVGRGATGPQKLDRQNKTLANVGKSGAALHLFEVFEKTRYVYAGRVELAKEPYRSDQDDSRADSRFVWIFPLRRKREDAKAVEAVRDDTNGLVTANHLPHGVYAVISSDLREDQIELVNRVLDQLRQESIPVFDKRDVDRQRYEKALGQWHEDVLDQARSIVRKMIVKKKHMVKADNRSSGVVDDELEINSMNSEYDLREALKFLDRDDNASIEEVFEQARQRVSMPEVPKSLLSENAANTIEDIELPKSMRGPIDRARFEIFT